MRKQTMLVAGLAGLTLVTGVAAQQIPGLDTAAIERQAQQGGAALTDFVKGALDHAAHQDGGAANIVAAGTKALANAPDSLRAGTIQGVDLDGIISAARTQARGDDAPAAPVFIAFASTSMPEESLKRMIADVSAAGGTVVFRGFLPDGSKSFMAQLQKLVTTQQSAHVKIEPRLFRAFNVDAVPTYVAMPSAFPLCDTLECVSTPGDFDRISGNVTTAYALETFAQGGGPGAAVARTALAKLSHAE